MRSLRVLRETTVRFSEVRKRIELAPGARTLHGWARNGIRVRAGKHAGELVTLEFADHGRDRVTSLEAYFRFLAVLNGQSNWLAEVLFGKGES